MPYAKSKLLRSVCELSSAGDVLEAYNALRLVFPNGVYDLTKFTRDDREIALYDPIDYYYADAVSNPGSGQWQLLKTQCDLAWNITKGDPNIVLMVSDQKVDGTHPDLAPKLILPHDPRTPSYTHDCLNASGHGTFMASCAASETTEIGGTSNGFLAAASFKCQLMAYRGNAISGQEWFIQNCVHASSVMGARTITHCGGAGGLGCSLSGVSSIVVAEAIREIHANGTCIVFAAGNGTIGHHCGNEIDGWLPFWPLNPSFDERIMVVSSTDIDDNHLWTGSGNNYHSHFPEVDFCAPGYFVLAARNTLCGAEPNIYSSSTGTSFSSPNAASIAALVISVNPCFGAEDVQAILKSTTDPITDGANYPGMLGTGRLNAYQACSLAVGYGHYAPLTGSPVWDGNNFVTEDLVIEPGTVLTITGKVRFTPQAKLVIKQGAKVIIDGGEVTNAQGCHDEFWPGIEVWGDNAYNQTPSNQPAHQGMLVLKNGAIIRNAREAIRLQEGAVWETFGGVIHATDAHFINCRRTAAFASYQNTTNLGIPISNRSFFTRCEFRVDDNYLGGNDFYAHVSMWDVNGIRFNQCDFVNAQTTITESTFLGYGIISLDAGYSVNGKCDVITYCNPGEVVPPCPPGMLVPSRFIGLDHGIHAMSSGANGRTFAVNNCDFENNICGVFTRGVNNFKIQRSTFTVGGRNVTLTGPEDEAFQNRHRAIYNYGGFGFSIQENSFDKDPGSQPGLEVEGPVMGYTGAYNDQVYNNDATGLDQSFVGEGICYDQFNGTQTGLQFTCDNAGQNAGRDFVVRTPPSVPQGPENCIRQFQGSTAISAGNSFTNGQQGVYSFYNYDNEATGAPITYFWQQTVGGLPDPLAYNYPWVIFDPNPLYASPSHSCPSKILCPGIGHEVRVALAPILTAEKLAYQSLKYVFESLLDGGDFDDLRETIMSSWPTDAWELRNELMSRSPYLSVEILMEAASKNILPDAMMLEICLANPEATKQEGFVQWIEFEAANPLPHYMVEQIYASWDERSLRTSLESSMAAHLAEWSHLNDEVIGALRNDSISEPVDSILVRWQLNSSLGARFGEAQALMELGRFDDAEALMTDLPDRYRLAMHEQEEQTDMIALVGVYRSAATANMDLFHLPIAQQSVLATLADGRATRAGIWAQNLLCFAYGECTPALTGGSMPVRSLSGDPGLSVVPPIEALRVYPNPAASWITFETHLPENSGRTILVVRDVASREVMRIKVRPGIGQQIWDVRDKAVGTYTAELISAGAVLDSQRFIVQP
jgi:subtilisin family serine protease